MSIFGTVDGCENGDEKSTNEGFIRLKEKVVILLGAFLAFRVAQERTVVIYVSRNSPTLCPAKTQHSISPSQ